MSYIPTLCDGCQRVSLELLQSPAQGAPKCSCCDAALRVIPSRSYSAGDVEVFDELSDTVSGGNLSALEAYRLSVELEKAIASETSERIFEILVLRWPGLVPLLVTAGANPVRQRRSLHMLKTIFEALSLTRRSDTVASADLLTTPSAPARSRGAAS